MTIWTPNLRQAARRLLRDPGFSIAVIATLALAVGANTAIFSIVNALLLEDLPYAHPERLGTISSRVTGPGASDEVTGIDGEKWELLRDNVPALVAAVSGGTTGVNLQAGARVEYVQDGRISAHYLDVLALKPLIGRNFSEEEDRPHGPKAVILSYSLWRDLFGADPDLLGQAIALRSEPYTVIGVLPQGATTPLNAGVYTSLQSSRQGEGAGTNFELITRLRERASWQEADAQINRAWAAHTQAFEKENSGSRVTFHSVSLQKGQTDSLRPQALGLMAAAGFILLIACANLAGLTLVRVVHHWPELATRLALGASPWQIQKQFWTENLLLAMAGGTVAISTGFLALRGLLLLVPEHFLPVTRVSVNGRVLAFTAIVSLAASILVGMLPALGARRMNLRSWLANRGGRAAGGARLRSLLVAGEVALTLVLLVASGLLIRTLILLETLPRGFNPNGVLVAKASLDDVRFHDPAAFRKLLEESTTAMKEIPGVVNAAVGLTVPYERALNDGVTLSDGKEAGQTGGTDVVYVTPGYFHVLGMPLLIGRAFADADGPSTQRVAVVNVSFARRFYGASDPVGRYLNHDTLIVGEVADVPVSPGLERRAAPLSTEPTMYIPAAQMTNGLALIHIWFQPDWIVRTAGPVLGLPGQIQRAMSSADPNLPVSGYYSISALLARTLAMQRIEVALLGVMAFLALLLSGVGIFSLVANMVAQRTREIGVRMALGSTVQQAILHVARAGLGSSLVGIAVGLVLSAWALRIMRSLLYGVGIYDATTLGAAVLTLLLVAALGTCVPALRVAKIDPAIALREE